MTRLSAHAEQQAALWGTDPRGWAELSESHNEPLFDAVLGAAGVRAGIRLLDVGCGTGRTLVLAAARGAVITGLDVAQPLLDLAAERLPTATLVRGELDSLPFEDASFDAVTGVNAFQFAADPHRALAEVARVLVPGGWAVASLFAEPERSESAVIHQALSALVPATVSSTHTPYLLSAPGNLEAALSEAGLEQQDQGEVECVWAYADLDEVERGLLASGGGARSIAAAGRAATAAAIREAVTSHVRSDGSVRMRNTFRWISATKPAGRSPQ